MKQTDQCKDCGHKGDQETCIFCFNGSQFTDNRLSTKIGAIVTGVIFLVLLAFSIAYGIEPVLNSIFGLH